MTAQMLSALLARYRLHLSFLIFVSLMIDWQFHDGGRPTPFFSWEDIDPAVGLFWVIAGAMLRSWAAGVIQKRTVLATEGPYALVRHPLYLGSFLIALGFAQITDEVDVVLLVLITIPSIYMFTIRNEERRLAEKFGLAWDAYAHRVGAFLPRFPLRFSLGNWSWGQWLRNREWRILVRVGALVLALELWNAMANGYL